MPACLGGMPLCLDPSFRLPTQSSRAHHPHMGGVTFIQARNLSLSLLITESWKYCFRLSRIPSSLLCFHLPILCHHLYTDSKSTNSSQFPSSPPSTWQPELALLTTQPRLYCPLNFLPSANPSGLFSAPLPPGPFPMLFPVRNTLPHPSTCLTSTQAAGLAQTPSPLGSCPGCPDRLGYCMCVCPLQNSPRSSRHNCLVYYCTFGV